jgi:uncharacterized protein
MGALTSAVSGLIFGLGLILAGMTDPMKVKGFLDVAGLWDPSLGLVMGGAIAVGLVAFARARRMPRAWDGSAMNIPVDRTIDARLIIGGALFGLGWGIAGLCPGPAIVALGSGMKPAAIFLVAMLAGMLVHDRLIAPRKG